MGEYAVEKREITPKKLFLLVIFQQYRKPGTANDSYQGICTSND